MYVRLISLLTKLLQKIIYAFKVAIKMVYEIILQSAVAVYDKILPLAKCFQRNKA